MGALKRSGIGWVALWAALLVAMPAWAQHSLAVTSLSKAAGSEQYDGLGTALAGMMVADLSSVSALRLVERDRLDALLDEMALGETGFVDPATAQRLGEGVGAAFVVVGSYSVVGETFALDARIVATETGDIVKAAAGTGTIGAFVDVEKEVVTGLVDGLEVDLSMSETRKLLGSAATESFEALAAYGEGEHHSAEGELDEARAAYERALDVDPAFTLAKAALTTLRDRMAEIAAADREYRDEVTGAILRGTVDERTRAAGFRHDGDSQAAFALRLMALEDEGLHCQRAAEMEAYLARIDWAVAPVGGGDALRRRVRELAGDYGLVRRELGAVVETEAARDHPADRARLFDSAYTFILEEAAWSVRQPGSGLIGARYRCLTPEEFRAALDALKAESAGRALGTRYRSSLTFVEVADLRWAMSWVEEKGAGEPAQERLDNLVDRRIPGDPVREDLVGQVEHVARAAEQWDRHRRARLGLSEERIVGWLRAIGSADADELRTADPTCAAVLPRMQSKAAGLVARYDALVAERDEMLAAKQVDSGGPIYGVLRDLGCLKGVPATYGSAAEAIEGVAAAKERLDPERVTDPACASYATMFDTVASPAQAEMARGDAGTGGALAASALDFYYALVVQDCLITEP